MSEFDSPPASGINAATQTALDAKVDGTKGVKVYRALLTQSGALAAPTATVLENSLGEVPAWQVPENPGDYSATTVANVFTANKTFFHVSPVVQADAAAMKVATMWSESVNVVKFQTGTVDGEGLFQLDDSLIAANPVSVTILVYP